MSVGFKIQNNTERTSTLTTSQLNVANTALVENLSVVGNAVSEQGWLTPTLFFDDSFTLRPEYSGRRIYVRSPAAGTEITLPTVESCTEAGYLCEWKFFFYGVTNDINFTTATGETISGRFCSNDGTAQSVSGSGQNALTYSSAQHVDGARLRITHYPGYTDDSGVTTQGGFSIWAHANTGAL